MGLDVDEEHKRAYHLPVFLGPFDSEIPTTESTPRSDSRGGRLSYNSEINWWITGRRAAGRLMNLISDVPSSPFL